MRVSANIASLPNRVEQLKKTVASLIYQVDEINICLNNYEFNPFDGVDKVNVVFSDNRLTDAGKFLFVDGFDGYYLTVDDDLIFKDTYVKDTIEAIDKFGIVSYHGRTFTKFPIESYYKTPAIRNRCLDDYKFTEPVQIAGTGVLGFHTKTIRPPLTIFKTGCMADIYFSIYADSLGHKIWGLAHERGYISYQEVPIGLTIYEEKEFNCDVETNVVNDYFMNKK